MVVRALFRFNDNDQIQLRQLRRFFLSQSTPSELVATNCIRENTLLTQQRSHPMYLTVI